MIYLYGGSKHLDAEEWLALEQAGDLQQAEIPVQVGDTYAGGVLCWRGTCAKPAWRLFSASTWAG